MAAPKYPVPTSNPNMMITISFFVTWLTSAVVIAIANMFFPKAVVLGTVNIPFFSALLLSSAVLAGITVLAMPFFTEVEMRNKKILSPLHWMGGYLVINFVGLWGIGRLAEILGLGMSSWLIVLILAAVLDFFQGMVMMGLPSIMKVFKA